MLPMYARFWRERSRADSVAERFRDGSTFRLFPFSDTWRLAATSDTFFRHISICLSSLLVPALGGLRKSLANIHFIRPIATFFYSQL